MNAHDNNSVFRAVVGLATPEFTRKLSYAEQEELGQADHAKLLRYYDWLFALNAPASQRWARRERGEDNADRDATLDRNTANAEGFGWPEQFYQTGTHRKTP